MKLKVSFSETPDNKMDMRDLVTAMADDIRREIDVQIMNDLMKTLKQQQINYPRYPQLFMFMHK